MDFSLKNCLLYFKTQQTTDCSLLETKLIRWNVNLMNQPTQYGHRNVLYSSQNIMLTTHKLLIVSENICLSHPRSRCHEYRVMTDSLPLTGCHYTHYEKYIKNTFFQKASQTWKADESSSGWKNDLLYILFSSCVVMSAPIVLLPVI